jgi:Cysteine-rich secretory protein family
MQDHEISPVQHARRPNKDTMDFPSYISLNSTFFSRGKRLRVKGHNVRGLQALTASVTIHNNCGFDAYIGIVYSTIDTANIFYRWPLLQNGNQLTLNGVSDSVLYIYGIRADDWSPVWTSQTSPHCFSDGEGCFSQSDVGTLQSGSVDFNICRSFDITSISRPDRPIATPRKSLGAHASEGLDKKASEWLKEHNDRRRLFYSTYRKDSLDLKWSESLRASAQNYANQLINVGGMDECFIEHGYNGDSYGGENLGALWGFGSPLPSYNPADALRGWFDNQINLPYGQKGHATQVVFRSTHYFGCGEADKALHSGGKCFIKVCRYLSPGNCNMSPENWLERTLDETVLCEPQCPAEGCF